MKNRATRLRATWKTSNSKKLKPGDVECTQRHSENGRLGSFRYVFIIIYSFSNKIVSLPRTGLYLCSDSTNLDACTLIITHVAGNEKVCKESSRDILRGIAISLKFTDIHITTTLISQNILFYCLFLFDFEEIMKPFCCINSDAS